MNWWRFVIAAEIRKILAFRVDFWITFLGQTLIQILIAHALWKSIFESTGNKVMQGFSLPMMTLYYLIVPLGTRMLTGENVGFLSREIYDGTFNRYLLYPLSFFQYKTLTYLTYSCFYGLQLSLVYLIYQGVRPEGITFEVLLNLATGLSLFVVASYAYANLAMFIELISLWAENIWSLMIMCRFFCFFLGGSFIPLNFFPEWAQSLLRYTPFPYLLSLPVRATMGLATGLEIRSGLMILFFWSAIFIMAGRLLWKRGQFKYTGVGI